MTILEISNRFNAPVYHEETVDSTMNISRRLAKDGSPHGTVIVSDFQEKGRGRVHGRSWQMERGTSLPFTIMLRFPKVEEIPLAVSLRAGLAVCLAIEDFSPSLRGGVMIKWPNDIIIGAKKTAGILCEADGAVVHIGIGVNIAQKKFSAPLDEKATSISLAAGVDIEKGIRFSFLEKILFRLYAELETPEGKDWKSRIEKRLYKKEESVVFIDGEAGSEKKVTGRLYGISGSGELLIVPDGETEARPFITGELLFTN